MLSTALILSFSYRQLEFKIDTEHGCLTINNEKIKFVDINYITVEELEQPSMVEKTLTRGGCYAYMLEIIVSLKDGTIQKCIFNHKRRLYKTLERLKPYVRMEIDIDTLKSEGLPNWLAILLIIIGSIWIIRYLML